MPTLRSLLSTTVPNYAISDYSFPQGCQFIFQATCWTCRMSDWQEICCQSWIVPPGVTCATFEIWGGGGNGAGSCCCMGGPPGGSGAYSKKTIPVSAGSCYPMWLGPATDCSATNTGCRGCTTWITGPGLCNFCAEGGNSGCSYCYPACCTAMCTCGLTGSTATMLNSSINGTTLTIGSVSAGTVALNMKLTGTGVTAGTTIVKGSGLTWTVDRTQTVASTTITGTSPLYAQAYGGDLNRPGNPGCFYFVCCDNACWNKYFVPFPAGLVNQCGGVAVTGARSSGYMDYENCVVPSYIGWAHMTSQYVPGLGGITPYVTGGNCACGIPGRPGLIRITYK